MSAIATSPFQTPAEACVSAQTYQEASDSLMELWVEQGYCFTSGHLTDAIRRFRTDLAFRHASVGEHTRSAHSAGTMPSYDDEFGGAIYPVQRERYTTGQSRTPANTMVFVYAPDDNEADLFEFELSIKDVGADQDGSFAPNAGLSPAAALLQQSGGGTGAPAPAGQAVPATPPNGHVVVAKGKSVPGDVLATVHPDGRLCVPRLAFEALAQATGNPITGGQEVYVAFLDTANGAQALIRQDSKPNYVAATPTSDRLRLHLTPKVPLTAGDSFAIRVVVDDNGVSGDALTIDLAQAV